MKYIKESLPDLETLDNQLKVTLESSLLDFLQTTHTRREEVIGSRRFLAFASCFAIAVFFALYFIQDTFGSLVANILTGCTMIWLTVVILSGRRWLSNDRLLAREMNMALVPILTNTLDRMMMYTHNDEHREETKDLLHTSALMTTDNITIVSDDMYSIYGDVEVTVRELVATQKVRNHNQKGHHHVEVFKGVFVIADLNIEHSAETYISTDGDRSGFAHRTFWSDIFENSPVKETVLEWNDFENALHVASTNPTAAREILTPEFMEDVFDWWSEHKLNMRISFKGNKLYMLLPEASIKIATSTTSTKPQAIERYARSLVLPIWRSLMLVEDATK